MSESQPRQAAPATFLLSIYFGFQGALYLIAVAYEFYRFETANRGRALDAVPAAAFGFVIGISFLIGAFLLRRQNEKGLLWVTAALLGIAAQWLIAEPPPGYLLTFFISLIGVTVAWLQLAKVDIRNHSPR